MLEIGGGLDLGEEALGPDHRGQLGAQHLEGNPAIMTEILRPDRRSPCRPCRFPARRGSSR